MQTKDFWYDLPERLIAQHPVEPRDTSRLLVLQREPAALAHRVFRDLPDYLVPGDCLVVNNTRVIPARLIGEKEGSGGKMEFVLLKRLARDEWEVLVKPGRKAGIGARFLFGGGLLRAEVMGLLEEGNRRVRFSYDGVWEEVLDRVGMMPLPPYITASLEDRERYQTVYAKWEGSAAAPTAGLHFTPELMEALRDKGVHIAEVTLHVGLGTFRPVKVTDVREHVMHAETYELGEQACQTILNAKREGHRVIAVGTTSVRVLESVASTCASRTEWGQTPDSTGGQTPDAAGGLTPPLLAPMAGETRIFIYPGYRFQVVDGLITNFHLPESTLLMLVSAMAGRDVMLHAYKTAVDMEYRFFSFGDAMFILPEGMKTEGAG